MWDRKRTSYPLPGLGSHGGPSQGPGAGWGRCTGTWFLGSQQALAVGGHGHDAHLLPYHQDPGWVFPLVSSGVVGFGVLSFSFHRARGNWCHSWGQVAGWEPCVQLRHISCVAAGAQEGLPADVARLPQAQGRDGVGGEWAPWGAGAPGLGPMAPGALGAGQVCPYLLLPASCRSASARRCW